MDKVMDKEKYVLITAARNEEKYIENTIRTIIAQTVLPVKWIIISDGSTDRTDEIVLQYAEFHPFITLLRKTQGSPGGQVDFCSKVHAIMMGYKALSEIHYDYIGILDGDVTFDSRYYENILNQFTKNSILGIAGGIILDQYDDHQIRRSPANSNYVSGCIQLFRRKCFEDVDGLFPIREGGEDTIAAITAQMKGWVVEAFEELEVYHHKHSKLTREKLKEAFRAGRMFYALGSHPSFEIMKSIKRIPDRPFILASLARLTGYLLPLLQGQKKPVSSDFVIFLRNQQRSKLKTSLKLQGGLRHD